MASKKCAQCKYDRVKCLSIDYRRSAIEQKIIWQENYVCSICGHESPKRKRVCKVCELNHCPTYVKPNMSKIIHMHNYDKKRFITCDTVFDREGNCIRLIERHYFECSFCGKASDFVEVREYDEEKRCDMMNFATEKKKQEMKQQHEVSAICPITGKPFDKIDIGVFNVRPYVSIETYDIRCSECGFQFESS